MAAKLFFRFLLLLLVSFALTTLTAFAIGESTTAVPTTTANGAGRDDATSVDGAERTEFHFGGGQANPGSGIGRDDLWFRKVIEAFKTPFTIWGFEVSFYGIFLFSCLSSLVGWILGRLLR